MASAQHQEVSTTAKAKQQARQLFTLAQDKARIAAARTMKGETHELDIAIVKATASQFHVVPKEKHVRTLKNAVQPARPRREVQYVISELVHRLHHATDWLTALKSLMTMHRLMRETDRSFLEELLRYSESVTQSKGHVLNMDNFIDTTNIEGRDEFSGWVRAYGRYLDEQLEVFQKVQFYQEQEHSGDASKLRGLPAKDLLEQLPHLQRLLQRLLDCKPIGNASHDEVVQQSLLTVLKESFKMYKAISEGLINLADHFFEMEYLDAQHGLDIYKESIVANDRLQQYYTQIEQIEELKRAMTFPKLESPPADFLHQMEAYVKEAPRPMDESMLSGAGGAAAKKRSPPLRRGSKVAPRTNQVMAHAGARDPSMVVAFDKPPESAAKPAALEPDLLGFDGLDVGEAPAATQAPLDNGHAAAKPAGGASSYTDLLAESPAPAYQPAAASNDPFAIGSVSEGGLGAQAQQAPVSQPQQPQQQGMAAAGGPPRAPGANPFGAPGMAQGGMGQGGMSQGGMGQGMGAGMRPGGPANPFGASGGFSGYSSPGQAGSPYQGSPYGSMTAAASPLAGLGMQQPGKAQPQHQDGLGAQQAASTPPAAAFKKEGALHDPFAELGGIPRKQELKCPDKTCNAPPVAINAASSRNAFASSPLQAPAVQCCHEHSIGRLQVSPPLRASPASSSPAPGGTPGGAGFPARQEPTAVPFSGFGGGQGSNAWQAAPQQAPLAQQQRQPAAPAAAPSAAQPARTPPPQQQQQQQFESFSSDSLI